MSEYLILACVKKKSSFMYDFKCKRIYGFHDMECLFHDPKCIKQELK